MNKFILLVRESGLARFLIPAGIILIIFGCIFFRASNSSRDYIETEATVTNVELEEEAYLDANGDRVEATYLVRVRYTVDGKTYEEELGGLNQYNVGDSMKIYYNPDDPSQLTMSKSFLIPTIIVVVGLAAVAGGVVSGVNAIKKCKRMKEQEDAWANG